MSEATSPRFAELLEHYRRYYVEYQTSQGVAFSDADADAYARPLAEDAYRAEGGVPPVAAADAAPAAVEVVAPAPVETTSYVAPVIAPLAAPSVALSAAPNAAPIAGASAPAYAMPSAAPAASTSKKSRKPLAIVLAVVGGVLVLALVAAAIFVVPMLLGGSASSARIADIRSEPEERWSYETTGADEEYLETTPVIVPAGGDRLLVTSTFDYSSWLEDNAPEGTYWVDWYAGIDADYQIGWDAGESYSAAREAWWADYSAPYPDREDYFPEEFGGVDPYEADYDAPDAGMFVGWDDAVYGEDFGTSLPPEPVTPDDPSTIEMVSAGDGSVVWSVLVDDVLEGHDPAAPLTTQLVDGGARVLVFDSPEVAEGGVTPVALLDASNGTVVSSAEIDGAVGSAAVVGSTFVAAVREGAEDVETEVRAYPIGELGAKPTWSYGVGDDSLASVSAAGAGTVEVMVSEFTEEDGYSAEFVYLAVADGEETPWSDELQMTPIDGGYLATSTDDMEISRIDSSGKEVWSLEFAYRTWVEGTLFVWDDCTESSCEDMTPIDLGTGEPRWSKGVDDMYPIAIQGDRVLAQPIDDGEAERQLVWLSLGSGEVREDDAPKLPSGVDATSVVLGQSMLFVADEEELTGFDLGGEELWSVEIDADQSLLVRGGALYLWSSEDQELTRLG